MCGRIFSHDVQVISMYTQVPWGNLKVMGCRDWGLDCQLDSTTHGVSHPFRINLGARPRKVRHLVFINQKLFSLAAPYLVLRQGSQRVVEYIAINALPQCHAS